MALIFLLFDAITMRPRGKSDDGCASRVVWKVYFLADAREVLSFFLFPVITKSNFCGVCDASSQESSELLDCHGLRIIQNGLGQMYFYSMYPKAIFGYVDGHFSENPPET